MEQPVWRTSSTSDSSIPLVPSLHTLFIPIRTRPSSSLSILPQGGAQPQGRPQQIAAKALQTLTVGRPKGHVRMESSDPVWRTGIYPSYPAHRGPKGTSPPPSGCTGAPSASADPSAGSFTERHGARERRHLQHRLDVLFVFRGVVYVSREALLREPALAGQPDLHHEALDVLCGGGGLEEAEGTIRAAIEDPVEVDDVEVEVQVLQTGF